MTSFYNKLRDLGLCKRCAFRYLGIREISVYEDCNSKISLKCFKGELLIEETPAEPASKIVKSNICVTCLGLLDELVTEDALSLISDHIKQAGYDSLFITCAVSLPIALQLRAHAMGLYLEEQDQVFDATRVVPIKEAWKWVCLQRIADSVTKTPASGAVCDFSVNITVTYAEDKKECDPLQKIHSEQLNERRKQSRKFHGELFTRQSVEALLERTKAADFKSIYSCPPETPDEAVKYSGVTCSQNPLFIAGRYNKFSRELSQTPWLVEGERRIEGSVQEFVTHSLETFLQSKPGKFVASGREDVDVRTLGRGRPFAVELPDPHRTVVTPQDLARLQVEINSSCNSLIAVRDLQLIPKEEMGQLKQGEESKSKEYVAYCRCVEGTVDTEKLDSLGSIKDLVLSQKTPIRVLHRRPLATRARTVMRLAAKPVDAKHFKVYLRTQAGTYVKEFVHGDFGRTLPNLGVLLGTPVDILALDVVEVALDWPKPILLDGLM